MNETVISVENLSKAYALGNREKSDTLFGAVANAVRSPLRNLRQIQRLNTFNISKSDERGDDILWALRDVSFEIKRGEVLGIIGRNGAGKSTLLKILSRITYPTHGRAEIRGRVSALLEVGTGFHPELSGRENIYMNGTILGMRKAEIDKKFDEIVEFCGIERFLDTPVKRYSSGMTVRLAFAVSAHLEPEILIIDEVLAVGDAKFQKKCLGKMQEVAAGGGRTVLFVSHNMTAVRNLCSRCLVLEDGTLETDGTPALCIKRHLYGDLQQTESDGQHELSEWPVRKGSGEARILRARLRNQDGSLTNVVKRMAGIQVEFEFHSETEHELNLTAVCVSDSGISVLQLAHQDTPGFVPGLVAGTRTVRIRIDALPLQCGNYTWTLALHSPSLEPIDVLEEALPFTVVEDPENSTRPYVSENIHGLCTLLADWSYQPQ